VWAGYGGVRLVNGTLRLQRPRLPPNCTHLGLRHVSFQGALINVHVEEARWGVALDAASPSGAPRLQVAASDAPAGKRPQPLTTTQLVFEAGTSAAVTRANP